MAESVQISDAGAKAKLRSPVFVGVMTFVTLNVYSLYWWYAINRELAILARARDLPKVANRPWLALLAFSSVYLVILAGVPVLALTEIDADGEESGWGARLDIVWLVALVVSFFLTLGTAMQTFKRVKHAQASSGVTRDRLANGIIFAVCFLVVTPVGFGYLQQELNNAWRAVRGDLHPVPIQPYFSPGQATEQAPSDPA